MSARDRQHASPEELMRVAEMMKEAEEFERNTERRGERRVLLKQLRLKFGDLPPSAVARVEVASSEELEAWVERVLTAKGLDEVLGEG